MGKMVKRRMRKLLVYRGSTPSRHLAWWDKNLPTRTFIPSPQPASGPSLAGCRPSAVCKRITRHCFTWALDLQANNSQLKQPEPPYPLTLLERQQGGPSAAPLHAHLYVRSQASRSFALAGVSSGLEVMILRVRVGEVPGGIPGPPRSGSLFFCAPPFGLPPRAHYEIKQMPRCPLLLCAHCCALSRH
jgi:hypothetical protein